MNTYHARALLLAMGSMCAGAGCMTETASPGPVMSATATIENLLPADGCSYVVKIDDVSYAPDAASREAIIAAMLPSRATVAIEYRVTGKTGQVDCGNASGHAELPEIALTLQ
jgi:hypothetical protein